jgi:hypothetical protein
MFAAFDWNEVLIKAEVGAVTGAIGGACYGVLAYMERKGAAKKEAQREARERARIQAQIDRESGTVRPDTGNSIRVWFVLVVLLAIIGGVLVVNPSLVGRLSPAGREASEPAAPRAK